VQEYVRFPAYLSPSAGVKFSDVSNGIAAFSSVPFLGWVQLIAFVGFLETISNGGKFELGYVGEFGRVAKLPDGPYKTEKLTKELQNGRLAMLAILELLTHDIAKPAGESLFTLHHF